MNIPLLSTSSRRLLSRLLPALLGQGSFTPGRPDASRALARLGEDLCRWLGQSSGLVLTGGDPVDPITCRILGLTDTPLDPTEIFDDADRSQSQLHLAGFWKDRRLVLISLRNGLSSAEFEHLFHLLTHYTGKGLQLRNRIFEEQTRGHLPHVSMVFLDDLPETNPEVSWPARVSLGWLYRDLNLLSRAKNLSSHDKVDWREQLLGTANNLASQCKALSDFFANLDLIAEEIDNYDKDELVFALLEYLDDELTDELCLDLCAYVGRYRPQENEENDPNISQRYTSGNWITRRLAEHMMQEGLASPQHYHALVLHKVLLYEEIPQKMRPRVASLQVLTSFLSNPQKYFSEVENSHSPEVLATRLWRILEMVPRLVQALRFDVARQVLGFSQRFGPTFELHHKPELMQAMMDSAAGVLLETNREQQASLMKELPLMGRVGHRLLIDLADHNNRSVRRTAIDALIKVGQPVVPVLFDTLGKKQGWHYLRNMLLVLNQLNAGGPKVEKLFRQSCKHPEANVRKEALPGLARLIRGEASSVVAAALHDSDLEVRKRAAACLAVTGISSPDVYTHLARMLTKKDCSEEYALQIITSINRLKPAPPDSPDLEAALITLVGGGGFMGVGGRKGSQSANLRLAVIQALGFVGRKRAQKVLKKMSSGQGQTTAKALSEALERLSSRV